MKKQVKPESITFETLCEQLAEKTDYNNHNGSILLLAEWLGEPQTIAVIKHVMGIHVARQSMDFELIAFRSMILRELIEYAETKLDVLQITKLKGCF